MNRLPKQRTDSPDEKIEKMLKEIQRLTPQMLLVFQQDALLKREKHMAFVRAGFTDAQAFELCK